MKIKQETGYCMFIWVIGYLFTLGYAFEQYLVPATILELFLFNFASLISWPLMLGIMIKGTFLLW